MLRKCRWGFCCVSGLAVALVGCASSRINTATASLPPGGVERTVSTEHLLRVADILEQQQQTERARAVYHEILKREPGHPVASARLNPSGIATVQTAPNLISVQESQAPNGLDSDGSAANDNDGNVNAQPAPREPASASTTQKKSEAEAIDVPVLNESPFSTPPKPAPPSESAAPMPTPAPTKIETPPAKVKSDKQPLPDLKRTVVSSELQTTKIVVPKNTAATGTTVKASPAPRFGSTRPTEPKRMTAEPMLRIMPRSKSGEALPVRVRTRKDSGLGLEEASTPVSAGELQGMIAGLMHRNASTRAVAAFKLGRLGAHGKDALPHLERALRNEKSGPVQVRLAEAIARIDSANRIAFDLINEALNAKDYRTRWEAVCAAEVTNRGSMAVRKATVEKLIVLLDDLNPRLREMAALKISEFGAAAAAALPSLAEKAQRGDQSMRQAATAALAVLQPGLLPPTEE